MVLNDREILEKRIEFVEKKINELSIILLVLVGVLGFSLGFLIVYWLASVI